MSLLKQILSPFVEFEDDKKKEPVKENIQVSENKPSVVPDNSAPIEENAEHPLITGVNVNASAQARSTVPSFGISAPLPEHVQYVENLIDEASANNPMFQGTDFKEFIDSKLDIDNIAD